MVQNDIFIRAVTILGGIMKMDTRKRQKPIILESFEGEINDWTSRGDRCQSVSISHVTYPEPVRFGLYALKLSYDFTNTIGTSGAYAYVKEGMIIRDYPSSIGMWVFGDGSGHMIRAQMRDGNQHAFQIEFVKKVNWYGWKFIEASIPHGRTIPFTLETPIRIIETSNDNKDAGFIYIDDIQAMYGENDQDVTNPEITKIYPAEGEIVHVSECRIRAQVVDEDSGVNPTSIKLYVDGIEVKTEFNERSGEVSSTHQKLLNGSHKTRLVVQDHAGNESEKIWQFEMNGNMPGIKAHSQSIAYIGNLFEIKLEINKLHIFDTLKLHFVFNPDEVEVVHNQLLLHEQIAEHTIIVNEITETGHMYLELKGLHSIQAGQTIAQLGKVIFRLRSNLTGPVKILFQEGLAKLGGSSEKFRWHIPPMEVTSKAHYKMCIDRATIGFDSNITVIDEWERPVEGARIINGANEYGITNKDGVLSTNQLAQTTDSIMIQAQKERKYSFLTRVKVLNQLCSRQPTMLNITFGEDLTCMNITWVTSSLITDTCIEYVQIEAYEESGFTGGAVNRVTGISKEYAFDNGEVQVHRVSLTSLEKETCYVYRVGDGTNDGWSKVGKLCTPKHQSESFNFLLLGDTQAPPNQTNSGYGLFKKIMMRAKSEYSNASFFVHVGDMIDDGNLFRHWEAFFQSINNSDLALSMPIVPTVGNHENIGAGLSTFKTVFNVPNNGPNNFHGTVYSFDYGNACFAVLNTETTKEGLKEQANWLKTLMQKTERKWKIIVQHRSPYYSNPDGGSENVQEVFPAIFDELEIDLVISGHDHSYIRTCQLKNGEINSEGTTYLIAGSTGNKFYAAIPQSYMKIYFDEKTQVYTNVTISNGGIQILVKKLDGSIIDRYQLTK
ncbi:purple acid phosphatase family protein [Lederbergia lenta]|uniref:purple acid phosphatase family protein n=1 Tax=Lederbergia lenta TaxID=1467 RepID=UPI00203D78BB|nr:metallophosphoesterase family protein [Lederbergia lenta]MCM3112554.1 metallophosphoesterase family protein [Lederbergia lenta]